jgi:hypothetical protein
MTRHARAYPAVSARTPGTSAAATVERVVRPSAPPTCLVVFISPEAAPASAGSTPLVTAVVIGVSRSPLPMEIRSAGPSTPSM